MIRDIDLKVLFLSIGETAEQFLSHAATRWGD